MLIFKKKYAVFALLLLLAEIMIALWMRDRLIRPYGGDFLVVMLIYCTIKTFLDLPAFKVAVFALVFAYAVELSQYFRLINLLGLQDVRWAVLTMGKSFQWYDMLAYTVGITVVLLLERTGKIVPS